MKIALLVLSVIFLLAGGYNWLHDADDTLVIQLYAGFMLLALGLVWPKSQRHSAGRQTR